MEIVLTEEEIENLPTVDRNSVEENTLNKCDYCDAINRFLRKTVFFNKELREYCGCSGCNKNIDITFYQEKELSKKEYFYRFIEQPLTDDIRNSKVKIMNGGVIFIDESDFNQKTRYFIKQAINPDVMFEGVFKQFNFGGQLDKTLDLTETIKDEKHNIYILKAYYRVFKTLANPKRFSI